MNDGIEAFRSQLQKELGLSIGPKDPLLALWVSQKELLEQNAAQQQKLLSEFQAALGKSQTAWSEQAKALAQQSLNAGLQAAQQSTALLLEEASRMNAAAIRQAFEGGVARMEQALAAGRRIAWLSLPARRKIPDGSDRFANRSGVLILVLCTDNHRRAPANSRESGLSTI